MFRYTPQTIPPNIFVIGAGGTGSRLMPMLVQFIRSITRGQTAMGWLENPTIWVVDDDVVETKNLLRQNFIQNDVGKPKAQVVAERYGRAYGVDVIPLQLRIDGNNHLHRAINETLQAKNQFMSSRHSEGRRDYTTVIQNCMVISCVDSAEARRQILNNFMINTQSPGANAFFIDAGNEDSFGQVNFFNGAILYNPEDYDRLTEDRKIPKFVGSTVDIDFLPMNPTYYQSMVDTESTASCADLNQTLAINALMATTIMGIVQNYYFRKQFTYNCVRLSLDGANSTEYLTFNNLKRMAVERGQTGDWQYGYQTTSEKSGRHTNLVFSRCAQYVPFTDIYSMLRSKIAADAAEAERQRAEEERKALIAKREAERQERLKVLAKEGKVSKAKKSGTTITVEPTTKAVAVGTVLNVIDTSSTTSIGQEVTDSSTSNQTVGSETTVESMVEAAATPARRRRSARVADSRDVEVDVPEAWVAEEAPADPMQRAIESVRALNRG